MALVAFILCIAGMAILFHLDRDSVKTSKALWIVIVWVALIGSRPVSMWFGLSSDSGYAAASDLEGSPFDAAVFGLLILVGVSVLIARSKKTGRYLTVMTPIILYFGYCLLSVFWSPVPVPSLKRWIKDVGDVVIVLVVLTDARPVLALRRLFTKVAILLFPLSIYLIRYSDTGRAWDNDGNLYSVGVTTNKNSLGLILFVVTIGLLWNFRWLWGNRGEANRRRKLIAQGILLCSGLLLLVMAHSSTSVACFLLGSALMLAPRLRFFKRRPSRAYILGPAVFIFGGLAIFFNATGNVAGALGRDSTFTGRTDIWTSLFPAVTRPITGTGFDSFWNSPNVLIFQQNLERLGFYRPERLNEAHNGYIEVYLNLGWIGVGLVFLLLLVGYSMSCKAIQRDPELGGLFLAYVITGMIYSITEAGFRTLSPNWLFVLLAAIGASGAHAGFFVNHPIKPRASRSAESFLVSIQPKLEEADTNSIY
ncbi:MAG: O-antigen ligase family protein [Acidobacteria bacterium]|nr:O-antigen ligase family protein [Acidobacteriota bacterium]